MRDIILQPYFLYIAVPLVTVALGVFLKIVTRNDQHTAFKKDDLAVGLNISITALIMFITYSVRLAHQLKSQNPQALAQSADRLVMVPWVLLAFLVGIWCVSTLVRKVGWKSDSELRVFWGIIVPDIFGIVSLIFVVNWIGR